MRLCPRSLLAMLSFMALPSALSVADVITWEAASGQAPDDVSPAYNLLDESVNDPVLSGDYLTIETNSDGERMFYSMFGPQVDMPQQPVFEFNMQMVSSSTGTTLRHGAAVSFSTLPTIGNTLYIGMDEVFFLTHGGQKGPVNSAIDTDSSFHDYRIEIDGLNAGSAVTLFQDDVEVLSHILIADEPNNVTDPRIVWGNNTVGAHGKSNWKSFTHNVAAVPEPSACSILFAIGSACMLRRRRALKW